MSDRDDCLGAFPSLTMLIAAVKYKYRVTNLSPKASSVTRLFDTSNSLSTRRYTRLFTVRMEPNIIGAPEIRCRFPWETKSPSYPFGSVLSLSFE